MGRKPTGAPRGNPAWAKDPVTGKGKSGNPGGVGFTPLEVRKFIESKSMEAAEALHLLAQGGNDVDCKTQLAAIKCMLEWGIGKPAVVDPNGEVVRDEVITVVIPDSLRRDA